MPSENLVMYVECFTLSISTSETLPLTSSFRLATIEGHPYRGTGDSGEPSGRNRLSFAGTVTVAGASGASPTASRGPWLSTPKVTPDERSRAQELTESICGPGRASVYTTNSAATTRITRCQ